MRNLTKKFFAAVLALSLFAGFSASVASFAAEPDENRIDLNEAYLTNSKEDYIKSWGRYSDNYYGDHSENHPENNFVIDLTDESELFVFLSYSEETDELTGETIKIPTFTIENVFFNPECKELKIPDTLFGIPVNIYAYTSLKFNDFSKRDLFPSRTILVPLRIYSDFRELYIFSDSFANKKFIGNTAIDCYN